MSIEVGCAGRHIEAAENVKSCRIVKRFVSAHVWMIWGVYVVVKPSP